MSRRWTDAGPGRVSIRTTLLALGLFIAAAGPWKPALAQGYWMDGTDITPLCGGEAADSLISLYAAGMLEAFHLYQSADAIDREFCVPSSVSAPELGRVLCDYVERHPDKSREPGVVLGYAAFKEKWPCNADGG